MKQLSDRDKFLQRLPTFSDVGGFKALSYLLTQPKYINDSHRNSYLRFFIYREIISVVFIDKQKLKELEKKRIAHKKIIPRIRVKKDFLDKLIMKMQDSKKDNFFSYVNNQLFLISDKKSRKPAEKILKQMGLKIIYFRGSVK